MIWVWSVAARGAPRHDHRLPAFASRYAAVKSGHAGAHDYNVGHDLGDFGKRRNVTEVQ